MPAELLVVPSLGSLTPGCVGRLPARPPAACRHGSSEQRCLPGAVAAPGATVRTSHALKLAPERRADGSTARAARHRFAPRPASALGPLPRRPVEVGQARAPAIRAASSATASLLSRTPAAPGYRKSHHHSLLHLVSRRPCDRDRLRLPLGRPGPPVPRAVTSGVQVGKNPSDDAEQQPAATRDRRRHLHRLALPGRPAGLDARSGPALRTSGWPRSPLQTGMPTCPGRGARP
jgi:hypothetical protein